jgi:hypothetical protein
VGREEICSRAEGTNTQGGPLGGTSEQSTHTKYFYEGWISSYGDELAGEYKYSLALCPSLSAKISEEQSKKIYVPCYPPTRDVQQPLTRAPARLHLRPGAAHKSRPGIAKRRVKSSLYFISTKFKNKANNFSLIQSPFSISLLSMPVSLSAFAPTIQKNNFTRRES